MAVEAKGSVNETSKYPSKTDFIYSIHQGERNLWRLVKPRNGIILRYCTDAGARMGTDIMDSGRRNDIPSDILKLVFLLLR
jgi:hypothetical protein